MIVQYKGYNRPDNNSICVGMCFFSPIGYKKPLINLQTVTEELEKYSIPYYIIELLYPGQKQMIPNSFVVRADSVLFSKENLWNVLEKKIPDQYDKIIFMDSDVLFSDPDWLNKSYQILIDNYVIQPMEVAYKDIYNKNESIELDIDNLVAPQSKTCFAKVILNEYIVDLKCHHPGYALGIDRNFFHNIGGFFEYCITGSGDLAFWSSFIPDYKIDAHHLHSNAMEKYIEYKTNIYNYYQPRYKISYLKDCVSMHLYHGRNKNREYNDRQKYLPVNCNYYHNLDGVLQLTDVTVQDSNPLINYWIKRKEDEE